MESLILWTEKLQAGYGKKVIIEPFDLSISRGQFIGLLGPNGCGKSTIIKTLVRMLSPIDGAVYISGQKLTQISQQNLACQLSVVLTDRPATGLLTVFDVVSMGRYPHTGFFGQLTEEDIGKTWQALQQVGADHLAERIFTELSDGEKQKILVSRALAQEPELIVLDEPTSHLDTHHRIEVMLILRQLVRERGITVIASLHDVDLALKICDTTVLVKDGHIIASGPPEDVLTENNVAHLYGLKHATFSSVLGGVELLAKKTVTTFVIAGAGSGNRLYRSLVKHGIGYSTGILSESDVDYYIAHSMGATVVSSQANEPASKKEKAQAEALLKEASAIIDAGFPIGSFNHHNYELLIHAAELGKTIYTVRNDDQVSQVYGESTARVNKYHDLNSLVLAIRNRETHLDTVPIIA